MNRCYVYVRWYMIPPMHNAGFGHLTWASYPSRLPASLFHWWVFVFDNIWCCRQETKQYGNCSGLKCFCNWSAKTLTVQDAEYNLVCLYGVDPDPYWFVCKSKLKLFRAQTWISISTCISQAIVRVDPTCIHRKGWTISGIPPSRTKGEPHCKWDGEQLREHG